MSVQRWAGVSALGAFVVFAIGNALWAFDQPAPDAGAATVVGFYTDASDRIVAGGMLSLVSLALFAVFAALLRRVLLDHGAATPLADAAFGGLLLGLAAGLGAETVNMAAALRAGDDQLTEDLALALFDVSYMFGSYAAGPGFGVLTLAVSKAALDDPALLPRPVAILGLVIGAALVLPVAGYVLGEYTVAPAMLLLVFLGVRLIRASAPRPPTSSTHPAA